MEHQEILHRCFRCGYCKLPANYVDINCPAYQRFRFETFSPGGRLWLLRGLLEGHIEASQRLAQILFSCATCANCVEHCAFPRFKDEILDAITAGKELLAEKGIVGPAVNQVLTRLASHGNPYGLAPQKRAAWMADRHAPAWSGQEYLLFAGDVASYDDRGQAVARATSRVLSHLGISFGVLPDGEVSDGNEARALGESALFEDLAAKNIDLFREKGIERIITPCPHAFNAFKKNYPAQGGAYTVFHSSQMLALFLTKAGWQPKPTPVTVTFHDPCYLGRHNGDFTSPRTALSHIPGVTLVEMDRNRQNALCCGGGGGNVFTGILESGPDAPARVRVREALATGADILATACPTCTTMFEDAIRSENADDRLTVMEISELAALRLAG